MNLRAKGALVTDAVTKAPASGSPKVQVFVPYRAGLPPLKQYFRSVWVRRQLLVELSRTTTRAENQDTWFGRIWNVLNPLLLGAVYFLLVTILAKGNTVQFYLAYLLSGLFLFTALGKASMTGVNSMTSNSALVTKTSLPRVILPLSNVWIAIAQYLPTLVILLLVALVTGVRPHVAWIACIPLLLLFVVFTIGFVLILATLQVYFRDTRNFLTYLVRIWLYLTPVLWTVGQTPGFLKGFVLLNPMYSIVGGWSEAFVYGNWPPLSYWIAGTLWAVGTLLAGVYFFLSREREFAVRI